MFESKTYEVLVKSALSRVSSALDKREGSMVMNGVAPAMAELAQLYIGLDFVFSATYIATAPREYLIKRAADRNMEPYPASAAVFRAEFNIEVPVGTRFSCEGLNFAVTERMGTAADTDTGLSHKVTCETAGAAANDYAGALIPIEYMDGLTHAELVELLIPGDMRRKRKLSASVCLTVSNLRRLAATRRTIPKRCALWRVSALSRCTPSGMGV